MNCQKVGISPGEVTKSCFVHFHSTPKEQLSTTKADAGLDRYLDHLRTALLAFLGADRGHGWKE